MFNEDSLRTDLSEPSDRALRKALDMAPQYHGRCLLFHVVREEHRRPFIFYFTLSEELLHQIKDGKRAYSRTSLTVFRRLKRWRHVPIAVRVSLAKKY
jgi:nucleotide-binding universal stress UspA family protein